jgi:hypothetical protein
MSISFILVFMLSLLILKTHNPLYLLFLSIYGIDSILTITYRLWLKENIFEPHRKHLYQLLANEIGIPHPIISIIYSFIQLSICFIVYFAIERRIEVSQSLTIGLCLLSLLVLLFITARINIYRHFARKY